jgi:hypothetical protein
VTVHPLPDSYLIDTGVRYYFGPVDEPLLALNTVDADGTQWFCDVPAGWDGSAAVTPLDARQYGDGAYAGPTTYGPRTLSFGAGQTCLTVAPDAATAARAARRLLSIVNGRALVLYTQDTPDGPQSLQLRASGTPNLRWLDPVAFEWSAVMVAEDPFRFDAAQLGEVLAAQLPGPVGGVAYNIGYPWSYAAALPSGAVRAVNRGDEPSQATYRIRGPVPRPTVYSRRTGLSFTIDRVLAGNETIVADTATGLVTLNGADILDDLIGDLPPILPGTNIVQWSGGSGDDTLDLIGPDNQRARLWVATTSTWK